MLADIIKLAAEVAELLRKTQAGEPLTEREKELAAVARKDAIAEMIDAVNAAPEK